MKKQSIPAIILILSFILALSLFFVFNAAAFKRIVQSEMPNITLSNIQPSLRKIDDGFRLSIFKRDELIDLYGLSLVALNRKMVGNFEYVKDDLGIMQAFVSQPNSEAFIRSITDLNKVLKERNIPFVYVNLPNQVKNIPFDNSAFYFFGKTCEEVLASLHDQDIDILDIEQEMADDHASPPTKEFRLHTDLHLTTQAEYWMMKVICNHLSEHYGLAFVDTDNVFDQNQYKHMFYDFLGGYSRSSGKYFSGIDEFETMEPLFDTNLTMTNYSNGLTKTGDFNAALTNQYEKDINLNNYTYWIINYGQYPSPYYSIKNNKSDGPNLLIIMDSLFMRGSSYLSLACNNVVIIDPRFDTEGDSCKKALEANNFDAVIVVGNSEGFLRSSFYETTKVPDVESHISEIQEMSAYSGMWLDTINDMIVSDQGIVMKPNGIDHITLSGWACDFQNGMPLDSLYLQVGDQIMKCNYGIMRNDVAESFGNKNLINTGFTISFPVSYLDASDTLQFYQIGYDGTYMYSPVEYEITQ